MNFGGNLTAMIEHIDANIITTARDLIETPVRSSIWKPIAVDAYA
jgi:hypothetical protein